MTVRSVDVWSDGAQNTAGHTSNCRSIDVRAVNEKLTEELLADDMKVVVVYDAGLKRIIRIPVRCWPPPPPRWCKQCDGEPRQATAETNEGSPVCSDCDSDSD
jgi:hypothetical protein